MKQFPLATPASAGKALCCLSYQKQYQGKGVVEHRVRFTDGKEVVFTDHRRRNSIPGPARVIQYAGIHPAGYEPEGTFLAAAEVTGLPTPAARALQYISRHEGGFDAINTWDRARFSWGFIQFAGGRGLPRLLSYMKERNPESFHNLLGQYGIDVQTRGGVPECVCADPKSGAVLAGAPAERAYAVDPLKVAAFVHAGQDPEVKQLQIEAAIEAYARPALAFRAPWGTLASFLNSSKGMAMLIDRQVQEGSVRRLARAVRFVLGSQPALSPTDPRFESLAMVHAVRDASFRGHSDVARRLRSIYHSELPGPI